MTTPISTRILDRSKPFGDIFGVAENGAVYEQHGCLFNGQGIHVAGEYTKPQEPDAPDDPSEQLRQANEQVEELKAKLSAANNALAHSGAVPQNPTPAPVGDTQTPPAPSGREQLEALHPAQIKLLVEKQGLTPATGAGSKEENINQLLAAAEDSQ